MLKYILSIGLFLVVFSSYGNGPRVPTNYEFAGIKLTINESARKQIQSDVDALHQNQTYLQRKIEKVDLYFPIIERVFREENLPDDFKYLAIQESALISDAVSSSNAVGFWQFKEASAIEVGLVVNRNIDERMHITASSHGAAKYLKKNNFFFNNWLYALLAYNTGAGGAEQHINTKYLGKTKMEITKKTHWYVKKFLAHKIAFENEINKNNDPALKIYEYEKTQNKSIDELADYFKIDQQKMTDYNKWLKRGKIPSDKVYMAIVPVSTNNLVAQDLLQIGGDKIEGKEVKSKMVFQSVYKPISDFNFNDNQDYPKINNSTSTNVKINGIPGFIATASDDLNFVLAEYGISKSKFYKYNDLTSADKINGGYVYYLKAKKSKAKIHYHVVLPGENAWSISQKYGVKLKKLLSKNRMKVEKDLNPGMVMWLRFIRPASVPVEYKKTDAKNVIIKSIPNETEHPEPKYPEDNISRSESGIEEHSTEQKDEEFLFEEINDDTDFINENSYVDLKKSSDVNGKETIVNENSTQKTNEDKTVKKEDIYHIVKSKETLFGICRTYDVTIGELRQWNDIDNLDLLHVGQRILIKKDIESSKTNQITYTSTQFKTYTVKPDDTLYDIARVHDITIKELMDLNNKEDFTIKEGEVLKIKVHK